MFDVFKGQAVLDLFEEHIIAVTFIPANITHLFQPLDLTVNGFTKKYLKRKFNDRFTDHVYQQYEEKKEIEEIDVKLRLTTRKPLHAEWMTELYNHFTSAGGKQVCTYASFSYIKLFKCLIYDFCIILYENKWATNV